MAQEDWWKAAGTPASKDDWWSGAGTPEAAPTQATPATTAIERPKSGMLRRVVGDTAVDLGKGIIGVGEAAVGAANLVSGGYAGKGLEAIGYDPVTSKKMLEEGYSHERVAANKEVGEAKGFVDTAKAMIRNPSTIAGAAVESAPLMVGGGAVARGAAGLLGKAGSIAAPGLGGQLAAIPQTMAGRIGLAAAGEGAVGAGMAAEGIRQQTDDGLLTAKQTGLALASGAGTAALGAAGGKLAQKLGIADIDVALAGGKATGAQKNILRRAAEGVLSEGVFEEMPQSAQEQALQNVALGKPVMEGVAEASAAGLLAGGVMGGGFAAISRPGAPVVPPPVQENVQPAADPATTVAQPATPDPLDGSVINADLDARDAKAFDQEAITRGMDAQAERARVQGVIDGTLPPKPVALADGAPLPDPSSGPLSKGVNIGAETGATPTAPFPNAAPGSLANAANLATQPNPYDYQAPTFGYEAPTFPPAPNDGRTRLAQQAQAQGIDPRIVLSLDDSEAGGLNEFDDTFLAGYAKTLWNDVQSGRRTVPGFNPQEAARGPLQERPGMDSVGMRGDVVPVPSGGQDQAGGVSGQADGGGATDAGQAAVQGDLVEARPEGVEGRDYVTMRAEAGMPDVRAYPVGSNPPRVNGDRWESDRGSIEGEPIATLDGDADTGSAAVIEELVPDNPGFVTYRAADSEGATIGYFSTPDEAARAAEAFIDGKQAQNPDIIEGEATRVTAAQAPQEASTQAEQQTPAAPKPTASQAGRPSPTNTPPASEPLPDAPASQAPAAQSNAPIPSAVPSGGQESPSSPDSAPVAAVGQANADNWIGADKAFVKDAPQYGPVFGDSGAIAAVQAAPAGATVLETVRRPSGPDFIRLFVSAGNGDYDTVIIRDRNKPLADYVAEATKEANDRAPSRAWAKADRDGMPEDLAAIKAAVADAGGANTALNDTNKSNDAIAAEVAKKLGIPNDKTLASNVYEARQRVIKESEAKADADARATFKVGESVGRFEIVVDGKRRTFSSATVLESDDGWIKVRATMVGGKKNGFEMSVRPSALRRSLDANKPKPTANEKAKAEVKAKAAELKEGVPDFETYAEAKAWADRRAKKYPSIRAFQASPEYKDYYPKAAALYAAQNNERKADKAASLEEAGLKAGDRVRASVVGAFLSQSTYTGTVTIRGGEPWVKVDGGMTVSSKGRVSNAKMVRWDARWKKVEEIPAAPVQTEADRNDLERRAAEQEPQIAALSTEAAREGLAAIGETKARDLRDPKETLRKQHPDDVDTALKAAAKFRAPTAEAKAEGVVASQGPEDAKGERKFYVTIIRDSKVARLAGPFDTKAEAEGMVDRAANLARELDPRAAFDGFGVSAVTSENHKPGKLNERLGLPAPQQQAAPEAFEHNGTRIYPTKIKDAGVMWAVESPENQARRAKGERTLGGDSLHDTKEGATKAADFDRKQAEQKRVSDEAREKEEAAKRAETETRVAANRGKSIAERRTDAVLDKPTKLPPQAGVGRGTRRETMQQAVEQDRLIVEVEEFDSAAKKRDQDAVDKATRAGYLLGASNPNIPAVAAALEARDRIKANKYPKPSYRLYGGSKQDGPYYELSKTEFDYAQQLKSEPKPAAQAASDVLESVEGGFYSALLDAVVNAKNAPKKGNAEQWKGWLDGAVRRGEFKQSERDWLGLDAWLNKQPSVTREQLADFIRANEVKVEEVTLGADSVADVEAWWNDGGGAGEETPWDELSVAERRDAEDRYRDEVLDYEEDGTKFHQYQLPGGENYREVVLTMPGLDYESSHFPGINGYMGHVRWNERIDADGKRVLFIEEIQSDLHQHGRKRGYETRKQRGAAFAKEAQQSFDEAAARGEDPVAWIAAHPEYAEAIQEVDEVETRGVPDAPFKSTDEWAMLAFKRMVRHAAENGFDRIAWTTGEQQAERYDLSKQVDEITVGFRSDGRIVMIESGENTIERVLVTDDGVIQESRRGNKGKGLDELVGKEIADRIMALKEPANLRGNDLKIGGEGMKGFYDKILPSAVNKWAKKFGGKVGQADLSAPGKDGYTITRATISGKEEWRVWDADDNVVSRHPTKAEAKAEADKLGAAARAKTNSLPVHAIDLTPSMRDAALQGMPLFQQEAQDVDPADLTPAQRASFDRQSVDQKGLRARVDRDNGQRDAEASGVAESARKLLGAADIELVFARTEAGLEGLVTPGYMSQLRDQQKGRKPGMSTVGLYIPASLSKSGKPFAVVFTGNKLSPALHLFTAMHEIAGHHGLRMLLGDRLNKVLDLAYQNPTVKAVADSMYRSRKMADLVASGAKTEREMRLLSIEEALADLAAAKRTGNWQRITEKHGVAVPKTMQSKLRAMLQNIVQRIKELFGKRGVKFSDAQVLNLLENAWQAAQGNQATAGDAALESVSDATRDSYNARIDALFAGDKAALKGARILDRADVMGMMGLGEGPMNIAEGKVIEGRYNHKLTAADWKKVPGWLENPALVFQSEQGDGSRLVFIAPETVGGEIVRMIVQPNAKNGADVHLLVNAYDAPGGNPLLRWAQDDLLRYVDTKKSPALAARSGRRLPGLADKPRGSTTKILSQADLGKYRAEAGQAASIGTPSSALESAEPSRNGNQGVEFTRGQEALQSRLEQWRDSLGSVGRRSIGLVPQESTEPSAYADALRDEGKGATGTAEAQSRRLIRAAKAGGFLLDNTIIADLDRSAVATAGGSEHDVYVVGSGDNRLVIRNTANGNYGNRAGLTPSDYLKRLDDYNRTFPALQMRVIGVSKDAKGRAVIWSAQQFVAGSEFASQAELQQAMEADGWTHDGYAGQPRFIHQATGAIIEDAHTGNILHRDGELFPIDVQVEQLPSALESTEGGSLDGVNRFDGIAPPRPGETWFHGRATGERAFAAGRPAFFARDRESAGWYAQGGGTVTEHAVNARNPAGDADLVAVLKDMGITLDDFGTNPRLSEMIAKHSPYDGTNTNDAIYVPEVRKALEARGFDSLLVYDTIENTQPEVLIVWNPAQITQSQPLESTEDQTQSEQATSDSILESVEEFSLSDNPTLDQVRIPGEVRLDPIYKAGFKGVLQRLGQKFADVKPHLLATVPLNHLVDFAPKGVPAIGQYVDIQYQMQAFRNALYTKYDKVAQDLLKFSAEGKGVRGWFGMTVSQQGRDLFSLMHDSTIAGIDPTADGYPDEKVTQFEALKARYNALPEEGQRLYRETRDAYKAQSDLLDETISNNFRRAMEITQARAERAHKAKLQEINESGKSEDEKIKLRGQAANAYDDQVTALEKNTTSRLMALREMLESQRVQQPYFPLKRYGKHWVTVLDKGGTMVGFSKFQTTAEQEAFSKEMQAKGYTTRLKFEDGDSQVREMIDPEFAARVEEILQGAEVPDNVKDEVWQAYLERMPDMSMRKSFIHRQNVPGYHFDALKAFGSAQFHGSYQIARLKYGMELQETIDLAKEQTKPLRQTKPKDAIDADKLIGEIEKRHAFVMNPKGGTAAQVVTTAAFMYSLGANPAHLFLNATQTVMLGVPVLGSRYGFKRTAAALGRAVADFTQGKGHLDKANLSADDRKAFQAFMDSGLIDKTQAHDLAGVGETGVEYSAVRQKVMNKIGWFFHQSERLNREVTAMAAYRLARADGKNHETAVAQAINHTYTIHFDYSAASRARFMQGDTAKALLVFRNYNVNMLYRLFRDINDSLRGESPQVKREARKQLGAMMGMYGLFAGTMGMPFYGLAMALAGLGDDDDDPVTAEQQFVNGTVEFLGPTAASILLRGLPGTAFDIDLTERIGMPNLWFRSPQQEMEGRDSYYYWMEQLLGAGVGPVKGSIDGFNLIMEGQIQRGLERAMPAALRNPMQAIRQAQEGGVTSLDGDLIKETTGGDYIAKALGFQPLSVSEQYDKNSNLKNADRRLSNRREKLLNRYFLAVQMGDDTAEVMADVQAFNLKNPEYAITRDTFKRSARLRNRNKLLSENGIVMTRRMRRLQERTEGDTE